MNKLTQCKICRKEIAKDAKVCPECGSKNKKPIYRKWWIWAIIIAVVIIAVSCSENGNNSNTVSTGDNNQSNESIVYEKYTVEQLLEDLNDNALSAKNKYANRNIQITGKLANIDSDGTYISLEPMNELFVLTNVQCYLKTEEQKNYISNVKVGDEIVVKGKVKSVGEVFGYSVDIAEFVN